MTETKQKPNVRPGLPMSEEELKEWKKTFTDIQESIDRIMAGEDNDNDTRRNGRQICKTDCEERNA
jgi:hypothetical protein